MIRVPHFLETFEDPAIPHLGDSGHAPALQLGEDGQWASCSEAIGPEESHWHGLHGLQQPGDPCSTTNEGLS